jgi:hypothetical protein
MQISIPVSVGELFDKISILNNKLRFIEDKDKLRNIEREFLLLNEVAINLDPLYAINENFKKLSSINEELWFIEDGKRLHEKNNVFDIIASSDVKLGLINTGINQTFYSIILF